MKKPFYCLISAVMVSACAPNPYRASEKSYKKQLCTFKKLISKETSVPLQNGVNTQWVSTVNFNLRKPNFSI